MGQVSFVESIRLAQMKILSEHPEAFIIGEGVPDEKAIFGTTRDLRALFPQQVFDSPVSENGVTGICLGAAIAGMKPIMTFQRIDFALYAMDQIVNNAAKWKTMFNDKRPISFVMRMTVGRGWGQGVQHSQNLEALFAHVPGLRVVVPHDPNSAYLLLKEAITAPDPTIFIEHRWLHNCTRNIPNYIPGEDLTILTWGPSAQLCYDYRFGCSLKIINDLDADVKINAHKKILIVSDDWKFGGIAAEYASQLQESGFTVRRLAYPDRYIPASFHQSDDYYPSAQKLVATIAEMTGRVIPLPERSHIPHDIDPFAGKMTGLI